MSWLEELFLQSIRRERGAVYDEARDCVVGLGQMFYLDLLLREDKDAPVEAETASRVLAEHVTPQLATEPSRGISTSTYTRRSGSSSNPG